MAEARGAVKELTRRALYGLSRGLCYAPDCDEPVVAVVNGVPVCVGQVAHIVAAVSTGPRGDDTVVDREAFDNLLVLCGRHHKVIDDDQARQFYSVDVLRKWKADREAAFDEAALVQLQHEQDLHDRLPALLVNAFQDVTSELETTVVRLEAAGNLTHDIAALLRAALIGKRGGPAVGDGVPGIKEAFEEAFDLAGGAAFLGLPSSDAYSVGSGYVQHLRGGSCGHAVVISARQGRPAVIITADLWTGISSIGAGSVGGGAQGVGFPSGDAGGDRRYIGPAVDRVATNGGSWGNGMMIRRLDGSWRWTADLTFDPNLSAGADTAIDSQARADLRLRLMAEIPFAHDEPRATPAGRRDVRAELAKSESLSIIKALAADRIDVPSDLTWRMSDEPFARNDSLGITYDSSIAGPWGRAIWCGLKFFTARQTMHMVTSYVDARIAFDALDGNPGQSNTPVSSPLSLAEIVNFFANAWTLAFDILPQALGSSPADCDPGDRPRVGLFVINERPQNSGGDRTFRLADLTDFSPFGATHRSQDTMDIGVLGRGSLGRNDAVDVVRRALVRMGENLGYDVPDLAVW